MLYGIGLCLNKKEFEVLRLSYGLDCDKHSANEIAEILNIDGPSAYVRISELKKQAINKLIENVKESAKKIAIIFVRASPIMEALTGFMIAFLIYFSAKLIYIGELEVSNFFSFLAAMMLAYQPVRSLATLNITIQQGLVGAKSILPVIDYVSEVKNKKDAKELVLSKGEIKFEKISFSYNKSGSNILSSINLKIPGEKMTALVGHSGAGKTTILNLIPRFYDTNLGDIKIDDQSIYDSSIYSLRKNISLVSQDTTLFDDTILNNIAYANKNASLDDIKEASKYSFANEFIEKLLKETKKLKNTPFGDLIKFNGIL